MEFHRSPSRCSRQLARKAAACAVACLSSLALAPHALAREACEPDDHTLCFLANRLSVTVDWTPSASSPLQAARARSLGADTGAFWFFTADNLEVVAKVLDGLGLPAWNTVLPTPAEAILSETPRRILQRGDRLALAVVRHLPGKFVVEIGTVDAASGAVASWTALETKMLPKSDLVPAGEWLLLRLEPKLYFLRWN